MEQCEGNLCLKYKRIWGSAKIGCASWVKPTGGSELKLKLPPFLGHYNELHPADFSLFLNKNAASQFGLVQPSEGARHIMNLVRELSDQALCVSNYKVALSMSPGAIRYHELTLNCFLCS